MRLFRLNFDKQRMVEYLHRNRQEITGFGFFLILFIVGCYTILFAKDLGSVTAVRLPLLLETAEGLNVGAFVYSQGVRVGYVTSLTRVSLDKQLVPISFAQAKNKPAHGQAIIAVLSINRPLHFYPNYRIFTKHKALLSEKVVNIIVGDAGGLDWGHLPGYAHPWGEDIDKKKAVDALELSYGEWMELQSSGELPHRSHLLRAVNYDDPLFLFASVINENRRNFYYTVENIRDIVEKINGNVGTIGSLINSPSLDRNTNDALKELIYLTNEGRDGLESVRESSSAVRFLFVFVSVVGWAISEKKL